MARSIRSMPTRLRARPLVSCRARGKPAKTSMTRADDYRLAELEARGSGRQRGSACARGPVAVVTPEHLAALRVAREHTRNHEQQIGQPVEVARRLGSDAFGAREFPDSSLGPPHDRAREMTGSGSRTTTRQDEVLQRRQRLVEAIERLLEPLDMRVADRAMARDAKLAAEIEQVVLH